RSEIAPRISDFISTHRTAYRNGSGSAKPVPAAQPKVVAKPATKAAPAADRLQDISGIGPKIETLLNGEGITTFAQIAALKAADVKKLEAKLAFPGRIAREKWVAQAKALTKQ
ncbi:MAG: hypothetical protein KDJ88_17800, partial [Bauldia sp.]|nr:hypothetical protein [Bauldia sp.]